MGGKQLNRGKCEAHALMDPFHQRLDTDGFPVKEANPNVWDIYMREAKVYDTAMVERWKTAMEGLLIFAGLFSAAVTTFIIESYKTLQPDTSNATVDLLYRIAQQMALMVNGTQLPLSTLPPPPGQTPFSPGFAAIATNVLWFISLALSLACAVAATLVQQWARNYIHTIERRPSSERRARMRMYLFEGVERFKLSQVVDGVPALLHLALFSFLLGLIFFIQPISTPLTAVSIVILVVCVGIYLFATFLPLFAFDSPIQTPLTGVIWQKRIIRILYKTHAHSLLVVTALQPTVKYIFGPVKAIRVVWGALWTILDLFIRQMSSGLQAMLKLPLLRSCGIIPSTPTGVSDPSDTDARWTGPLTVPEEPRDGLAFHWSSHDIESHGLDYIRSSAANKKDDIHFQQREMSAFFWLVECLDEYSELLPFIEAIPNLFSRTGPVSTVYDPQVTFSVVVQQRCLEFHRRLASLSVTYATNIRAVSAYVDFYLCLNKENWIDLRRALEPEGFYIAQEIYFAACRFEDRSYPSDLRVRIHCLQGIVQSFWNPRILFIGGFEENSAWPARYLNLWRPLAKLCNLGRQAESSWTTHVHDIHLILSEVMLNIVQDLTPTNYKAFITFLDSSMMDRLSQCNDHSSCSKHPLPQEEQHLYCTTISLVVSVLDTEYRHEVPYEMGERLCRLFHVLSHMSEGSSLKVVNDLLQRPIWTRHWRWAFEFRSIVEAFEDWRDEEGQAYLSSDVMAKYHVLESFASYDRMWSVLTLNFDGPLFRGNTLLQNFLVQTSRNYVAYPALHIDSETGIEVFVLLLESVFQVFYFFDDHEMLEQASQVVNGFLVHYPYNAHALECRAFLADRIKETGYEDSGVQVLMQPEQGVQADLR